MRFATTITLARTTILASAVLASALATAQSAQAANGRNGMLFGGLAVGAAGAALLLNGTRRVHAAPVVEEEEVVYRPAPRYVPTCRMERRRHWIDSESYTYRRVEVCE